MITQVELEVLDELMLWCQVEDMEGVEEHVLCWVPKVEEVVMEVEGVLHESQQQEGTKEVEEASC